MESAMVNLQDVLDGEVQNSTEVLQG